MTTSILTRAAAAGLRMTAPRRVIAGVLDAASDHPDAEALHARAAQVGAVVDACNVEVACVGGLLRVSVSRPLIGMGLHVLHPLVRTPGGAC